MARFDDWYDYVNPLEYGAHALEKGKEWYGKKNAPQIQENPYLGQWGSLIGDLQAQSSSNYQGPSLAGNAYNQAHNQGINDVMSMSRGGSAGSARAGMRQMGNMNQGLAAGYSNARLQEQMAARMQLQGALAGAGNAWFQPQQANLQATMGTQSQGQQLMAFLKDVGGIVGSVSGGGGGGK
jgi:hypothetical protein